MLQNRRGFLGGLVAALAAPAIVPVTSLMPVSAKNLVGLGVGDRIISGESIEPRLYETLTELTRAAIALFNNSNEFLRKVEAQWGLSLHHETALRANEVFRFTSLAEQTRANGHRHFENGLAHLAAGRVNYADGSFRKARRNYERAKMMEDLVVLPQNLWAVSWSPLAFDEHLAPG